METHWEQWGVSFMPPPGPEKTQLEELTSQGERTVLSLLFSPFLFIYHVVSPSPFVGRREAGRPPICF